MCYVRVPGNGTVTLHRAATIIVWPSTVERHRHAVFHAHFLRIQGRIQRDGNLVHLLAETLEPFDELLAELPTRSRDFH